MDKKYENFIKKVQNGIITHDGKFHLDELVAINLIRVFFEMNNLDFSPINIIRTRTLPECFDGVFIDIGMGRFDHHQPDARCRKDGTKYSSAGLIADFLLSGIFHNKTAEELFDEQFIKPIDLCDNGIISNDFSLMMELFNPCPDEDLNGKDAFNEALSVSYVFLKRAIRKAESQAVIKDKLNEKIAENPEQEYLISEEFLPAEHLLIDTEIKLYATKADNEKWFLYIIKDKNNSMEGKTAFFKGWGGKENDELEKISGIKDLIFCHSSINRSGALKGLPNFLIAGKTRDSIEKVIDMVIARDNSILKFHIKKAV